MVVIIRRTALAACLALSFFAAIAPFDVAAQPLPRGQTMTGPCDRACLIGIADAYLQAMVAKDPARLLWATKAKYTENGMVLRVGEALWATATGIGQYGQHFADTRGGQVGWIGVVFENGSPVLLGLRLKVVNHRILEVEHIVSRGREGAQALESKGSPPAIFGQPLTQSERVSREQLITAANAYFDGIEQSSGKIVPFDDACVRIENGRQTAPIVPQPQDSAASSAIFSRMAGLSCSDQLDTGAFSYITEIRDRRFEVVDEEYGNVLAFAIFAHPGNVLYAQPAGKPRIEMHEAAKRPFDTQIAEVFKIKNGRIYQIEAVINTAAFGISSGWERD